jgi:hypothetical protein
MFIVESWSEGSSPERKRERGIYIYIYIYIYISVSFSVSSLFGKPHYPRLIHKLHAVGGWFCQDKDKAFCRVIGFEG